MKKNVFFLLSALLSVGVFAKTAVKESPVSSFGVYAKPVKGGHVSPVIEAKFRQQYGTVGNVSWSVIDDVSDERITIATFSDEGERKEVYYYDDGELLGIGKSITRDLLPENVTKSIHDTVSSAIIQTAYEFKERNAATRYYVRVVTPRYSMIVSANEFGDTKVHQKEKLKNIFE